MLRTVAGFVRNRRASAAVEFALILPVLLSVWAGMTELSHAIDEWRKLTLFARTVADLTAQGDLENPIDASTMSDILASAAKVMRPFDTSGVKIVVSAMGVDLTKYGLTPQLCSSMASGNATARTAATGLTVPPGFQTTGMRYMLAEVSVPYTPMIGGALVKLVKGLGSPITFAVSVPWPARGGEIYPPNTYTEVVLPVTNAKACDGSAP